MKKASTMKVRVDRRTYAMLEEIAKKENKTPDQAATDLVMDFIHMFDDIDKFAEIDKASQRSG